jgi:hypothetical protein
MPNFSHVNCISQNRKIHMGTHIYHVRNILSNLIIMLDFLIIMNIATFNVIHWRTPKSRVEPTWGFNYVELRKVGTWKAFPTSSTIEG